MHRNLPGHQITDYRQQHDCGSPNRGGFPVCGLLIGARGVLVVARAYHVDRVESMLVVVEPVTPVQDDDLGLAGVLELMA